jgi:N-acetylmuramoyl-L-alanine amidase
MAVESRRGRNERKAILRGVYDDNVATVTGPGLHASGRNRRSISVPGSVPLLLSVLLLLAGFHYRQGAASVARDAVEDQAVALTEVGALLPADAAMRAAARETALAQAPGDAPVAQLYGLEVRTIVIDAGHGGSDPGAIGRHGLMEKDVALDVARRLRARLERDPGYRILMTREDDVRPTLKERVEFANEHGADLFVSVHVNWLPADTLALVETFFYGPGSDAKTRQHAARENRHSGYTLAEFNELTQRLGLALKMEESKDAAVSIQRALFDNVHRMDPNARDWGVKTGDFVVLLGVAAPSVLVEIANLSNPAEEAKLNSPEHRERLATFLEEGIIEYLRRRSNHKRPTHHANQEE